MSRSLCYVAHTDFWNPQSWVSDHRKTSFFSVVLPGLSKTVLEEEGGAVYLPSCLYCVCELTAENDTLSDCYRITFLRKSELKKHKLWAATDAMDTCCVKDNVLTWFGHSIGKEEKYCTLSAEDSAHVRKDDVKLVLNKIQRLDEFRMAVLSVLAVSEQGRGLIGRLFIFRSARLLHYWPSR